MLRRAAISGSTDEEFHKEFSELVEIQRRLAVQEDQFREQELDSVRAKKVKDGADTAAGPVDGRLSAKGKGSSGSLSLRSSWSRAIAAGRALGSGPALSDASSLTTFDGVLRRYSVASPAKAGNRLPPASD